jgi:hypothetical protein
MWTNKASDGTFQSFGFVAPDGIATEKNEVQFPFHEKQTPAYAATLAVTVKQRETFVQPAALTGNMTINLTIDSQVTTGAKLYLKLKESAGSANRTVTLGDGFDTDASDVTVNLSTTVFKTFIYDGTAFVPAS